MPRPSYQPDPPARNTRAKQPLTMEGEHQPTIHWEFFHGQSTEDGKSWLERFEYYVHYGTLNKQKQSDVFPVFKKDAAWKWFSSLPQDSKATNVGMKAAFKAQFDIQREPAEYATDLLQTTQGANQRVVEYISYHQRLCSPWGHKPRPDTPGSSAWLKPKSSSSS